MCYSPVRHSLQPCGQRTFDLHVLGTPPAFILSQDQTRHPISMSSSPLRGAVMHWCKVAIQAKLLSCSNVQTNTWLFADVCGYASDFHDESPNASTSVDRKLIAGTAPSGSEEAAPLLYKKVCHGGLTEPPHTLLSTLQLLRMHVAPGRLTRRSSVATGDSTPLLGSVSAASGRPARASANRSG